MTAAQTTAYNNNLNKLNKILLMKADRRTNKQIMSAFGYTDEKAFSDEINRLNNDIRTYLRTYALELRTAGKTNQEIANTIGRSVSYVELLFDTAAQNALNGATSNEIRTLEVLQQKARKLANNGSSVSDINTTLKTSGVSYVRDTLLGVDFLKKWAKQLADDNVSVDDIAKKILGVTSVTAANRTTIKTYLGNTYLKRWAKRLASNDTSVSTIATTIGMAVSEVVSDSILNNKYMVSWITKLADKDYTVNNIVTITGYSAGQVRTYLGLNYLTDWAKRLADNGKTMSQIVDIIGYSVSDTQNILLGSNYKTRYQKSIDGGYMAEWVLRLYDSSSNPVISSIATTTGLSQATVNAYIAKRNENNTGTAAVVANLSTQIDAIKKQNAAVSGLYKQIMVLVRQGKRMSTIRNDPYVKAANANKTPAEADVRKTLSDKDKQTWIKAMAAEDISVSNIATDVYGSANNSQKTSVRTVLGDSYLANWARRLIDNGDKSSISDLITFLGSDVFSKAADQKSDIRRLLNLNETNYIKNWAKRLANKDTAVADIATAIGEANAQDVRTSYFSDNTYKFINEWIIRMIGTNPPKQVDYVKTMLGISKNDTIKNTFKFGDANYKKWALSLLDANSSMTIPGLDSAIGYGDPDTVRGWIPTNTLKAWVRKLSYDDHKTMAEIKSILAMTSSDAAITIKSWIGSKRFKSWAIQLAVKNKNWGSGTGSNAADYRTASEIFAILGVLPMPNSENKLVDTVINATVNEARLNAYISLIGNMYAAIWMQRIQKKTGYDNTGIRNNYLSGKTPSPTVKTLLAMDISINSDAINGV